MTASTIKKSALIFLILTAVAQAFGPAYRFDENTRQCVDNKGSPGRNPNHIGECGEIMKPIVQFNAPDDHLAGLHLGPLQLSSKNFSGSDFRGALFEKTTFSTANFERANFSFADLSTANVEGANFDRAIFNEHTKLPFSQQEALTRKMVFSPTVSYRAPLSKRKDLENIVAIVKNKNEELYNAELSENWDRKFYSEPDLTKIAKTIAIVPSIGYINIPPKHLTSGESIIGKTQPLNIPIYADAKGQKQIGTTSVNKGGLNSFPEFGLYNSGHLPKRVFAVPVIEKNGDFYRLRAWPPLPKQVWIKEDIRQFSFHDFETQEQKKKVLNVVNELGVQTPRGIYESHKWVNDMLWLNINFGGEIYWIPAVSDRGEIQVSIELGGG